MREHCLESVENSSNLVSVSDLEMLDATLSCELKVLSRAGKYQSLVNRALVFSTECDDLPKPVKQWRIINEPTQGESEDEADFEVRYCDWAFIVNDAARRFGDQYPKF